MGSKQIVLVSTAVFSVLNKLIFWREAKTKRLFFTVYKVNGLFQAPAQMSVIKLFLARNTTYFCGLKKLYAIARSSPGIFENFVFCTCSQTVIFPEILLPRPEIFQNI